MPQQSRTANLVQFLPLLLVAAAFFVPFASPWRPWLLVTGFSLVALAVLFVPGRMRRRTAIAFSAYMLCAAIDHGATGLWIDRPAWWDHRMMQLTLLVSVWICVQLVLDRAAESSGVPDAPR